jgi:hypothetical protein
MRRRALVMVMSVLSLAGCECGAPPSEPAPRAATRGGEVDADHGPAVRLVEGIDLAGVSDFEVAPVALAARAERARSWSGRGALREDESARHSIGNWLCRLETHFGPPAETTATGFRYVLRERATGYVITAYADGGGPALGGVLRDDARPIDLEQMSAIVDRFASLMDATVPSPCRLTLGTRTVGVESGEWFERRAPTEAE